MRRRLACEGGFTLVEALVAGLVLVIGALAAVGGFNSTRHGDATAERNQIASAEAEGQLEVLRRLDYHDLKLTAAPPASQGQFDPAARVSGSTFQVSPSLSEDLVLPADPSPGTASVVPYSTVAVGSGGTQTQLEVYRFVSWRDEECPLLDLASLDSAASDLNGSLGTTADTIDTVAAPGGPIEGTLSSIAAVNTLPGSDRLTTLLSLVNPLVSPLNRVDDRLEPLAMRLDALAGPLDAATDPVTGRISDRIDLCDLDLDTLDSLGDLRTVNELVGLLNDPQLGTLSTTVTVIRNALVPILPPIGPVTLLARLPTVLDTVTTAASNAVLAAVTSIDNALFAAFGDLSNPGTAYDSVFSPLISDLQALAVAPDTTHNTKRVTVAVVLPDQAGSGPFKPIWMSTVVSDPKASLGS